MARSIKNKHAQDAQVLIRKTNKMESLAGNKFWKDLANDLELGLEARKTLARVYAAKSLAGVQRALHQHGERILKLAKK